jgi:phosphatidylglycerol:prolipoprotein diacylglycerol transferase
LTFILGFWLFLALGAGEAARKGMDSEHVYNAGFYSVLSGLIGGRIAHALRYWEAYAVQPTLLISLNPGALAATEAVSVGLFAAWYYLRRHRLPLVSLIDVLAPGAALALAVVNLGQFLSGDAFGTPTAIPWAVHLWEADRHPVQLYQMVANLAIAGWLWRQRGKGSYAGWMTLQFLFFYSSSRLFLDTFRADVALLPGGLRGTQVLGLIGALLTLALAYQRIGSDLRVPEGPPDAV